MDRIKRRYALIFLFFYVFFFFNIVKASSFRSKLTFRSCHSCSWRSRATGRRRSAAHPTHGSRIRMLGAVDPSRWWTTTGGVAAAWTRATRWSSWATVAWEPRRQRSRPRDGRRLRRRSRPSGRARSPRTAARSRCALCAVSAGPCCCHYWRLLLLLRSSSFWTCTRVVCK